MNVASKLNTKKESLREIDVDNFDYEKWTAYEATEKMIRPKMAEKMAEDTEKMVEDTVKDVEDEAQIQRILSVWSIENPFSASFHK